MTSRTYTLPPHTNVPAVALVKGTVDASPDPKGGAAAAKSSAYNPCELDAAATLQNAPHDAETRDYSGTLSSSTALKCACANLAAAAPDAAATQNEADVGSNKVSTADTAPTSRPPTSKTALELAIDRCIALSDKSDTMVSEKWAKRAAPILAESLNFLTEYKAATEAEREAVRARLKAKSGVSRQPNVDNLPLIAVYMCVSSADKTRTKAQRKAWGRFKTVVAVAAAVLVVPDGAAKWLENKTLNSILAEWREMQKATGKDARKPSVPKALKGYKHLADALGEGSEFHDLAKAGLAKADAAIAEAKSEAAAKAGRVAASSTAEVATHA